MGMSDDVRAEVVADDRCPTIEPGPGRVVLTTVNRLSLRVLELTVEGAQGRLGSERT